MKFTELHKQLMEDFGADSAVAGGNFGTEGGMGSADYVDASVNDPGASNAIYIATYGNEKKKFANKEKLALFLRENPDWEILDKKKEKL